MNVYSHPLFSVQGRDFPGPEHPDRFIHLRRRIEQGERAYNKGDEDNADLQTRIEAAHSYAEELRFRGGGIRAIDHEGETFIDRLSYRTACAAVATSIYAAEARGFALVRPPGHHAHHSFTHGFCLFNNMAIATRALLENGERVLVLDLDVHHGCGTEELLEGQEDARMISLYQKDIWPKDEHYTYAENCIHLPLEGKVDDRKYMGIFQREVLPKIEEWDPTVIGVSLGLDTFIEESYGWKLTVQSIREIKRMLGRWQMFGILEGGYTPGAIRAGVTAFIESH